MNLNILTVLLTIIFSGPAFATLIHVKTCSPVRAIGASVTNAILIRDTEKNYPDNLSMNLVIMGESVVSPVVENKSTPDGLRYRLKDGLISKTSTTYFFQTNDSYAIMVDETSKDEDSLAPLLIFLDCK